METPDVSIVGAGIAGAACAVALRAGGLTVEVLDRGRAPGGRMASPELRGRRVDLGAGYFTARDDGFVNVVGRWRATGLAREWTDTFSAIDAAGDITTSTGPMRWGTPNGLRSLVRELLDGVSVTGVDVGDLPEGDVVVAMPDPQAGRLLTVPDPVDYEPVIAVASGFDDLSALPFADAIFVNDHPDLSFVAHDGARRGDGAPVLVAHTTAALAARHLDDPARAIPAVTAALSALFDAPAPTWTHAHRWTFAKPSGRHDATHALERRDGRLVGFAGDQWCPEGSPRVESAWRSGTDLAAAILATRS